LISPTHIDVSASSVLKFNVGDLHHASYPLYQVRRAKGRFKKAEINENSYSADRKRSADLHRTLKRILKLMSSMMRMLMMTIVARHKLPATYTHLDAPFKFAADE
jgi:inhibitor of KinA sporulation pathway (predicted exonuclease)